MGAWGLPPCMRLLAARVRQKGRWHAVARTHMHTVECIGDVGECSRAEEMPQVQYKGVRVG